MEYPMLNTVSASREMLSTFAGYNHNLRIGEGEFYEMTNLSSDNYPILSPRSKRGIYASPGMPQGMVAKDALCYVDGGDLIINKYPAADRISLGLKADNKPKTLISMGAYVIIMPDRKYINTLDYNDKGDIDKWIDTEGEVTFELCTIECTTLRNKAFTEVFKTCTDNKTAL